MIVTDISHDMMIVYTLFTHDIIVFGSRKSLVWRYIIYIPLEDINLIVDVDNRYSIDIDVCLFL